MKKDVLLKANSLICMIIVLGFIITSFISYHSNKSMFRIDVEHISQLTSEGIYHKIDSVFSQPINISLAMANDRLLKNLLAEERINSSDDSFTETMRDYLMAYKTKYQYDSVFLVSTATNRYYHYEGYDRTLLPDNPENNWYYSFLESSEEYSLNIDNDEAAENEITIFVNCKIRDAAGRTVGIVGVGLHVDYLQTIISNYEAQYHIKAFLVNQEGMIQVASDQSGYETADLFSNRQYLESKDKIMSAINSDQRFWYSSGRQEGYLVAQYMPDLEWYLIIDRDTSYLKQRVDLQFFAAIIVILVVIAGVLCVITKIIRIYNELIVKLTLEESQKHNQIFQEETGKIYENIYEIDITHNCAASVETEQYFESLGVPKNTPYDKALHVIAEKQIKVEYRQGYLSAFSPEHVQKCYQDGTETLRYDFMIMNDSGKTYYWMRITARIFYWDNDKSVRMFVYRQNIDHEKRHELYMFKRMETDSLTRLYNKIATQEHINQQLTLSPQKTFAFIMVDIDNFKEVNDTCGHAVGDAVISHFADTLRSRFQTDDIIGRIGGDEFVVFIPVSSRDMAEEKAQSLLAALRQTVKIGDKLHSSSASIGIALSSGSKADFETLYKNADAALYEAKKRGKDGYRFFEDASNRPAAL